MFVNYLYYRFSINLTYYTTIFCSTDSNMVKLFAMSVLYKGANDSTLLKAAFELQSFGYFQRKSVQEFMSFVTKTIVERTTSSARQSVKEKGLNYLV